ncbi:MAG: hypothetical protein C0617_09115 [Desulfuromonas sp.]|uniref:hypothetical protein n=1 Tax=Desulfuromonas sp. TaxID=892 RepID=UPI000CC598FC|nr:hypothetical protein [Desulfuromonas sp.]PLX84224.1 MAG: hypothetical protein C0617_09115 [Desulfuromonas sp.]
MGVKVVSICLALVMTLFAGPAAAAGLEETVETLEGRIEAPERALGVNRQVTDHRPGRWK